MYGSVIYDVQDWQLVETLRAEALGTARRFSISCERLSVSCEAAQSFSQQRAMYACKNV